MIFIIVFMLKTMDGFGWACNGQSAGTEGMSKRLEAIEIQLVKKGANAPGDTNNCFYKK